MSGSAKRKSEKYFCNVVEQRPIRLVREVHLNPGKDAQKNRNRLLIFLGLSLLLHALTLTSLYFTRLETPVKPPEAVFVDLNALPPAMTAQEREQPRQVVESEATKDQSTPEDAKYLGERNQVAEKETRAKTVESFRQGGAPSQAGNRGKSLSFKDLAPAKAITPPTPREMDGYKQEKQRQEMAKQESGRPGEQQADNAGSANSDYLKDVKDGDRTMLSTKEFVYFGYYRRIRERLEVAWNSKLRAAMGSYIYGGRHLATDRNYVTGVIVVLDRNGQITAVKLQEKSGATDLDQAAVDAFNAAGPFPDPPSGLVDENGEIKIPWSFILQS